MPDHEVVKQWYFVNFLNGKKEQQSQLEEQITLARSK